MEAAQIAVDRMYNSDAFSKWLGIEFIKIEKGHCILKMVVREEMTNGFLIAHGGISYSFADSAFAFASNSHGNHAVSIETSISHTKAIKIGDTLYAYAEEKNRSRQLGIYEVKILNQNEEVVALFKGTAFIKETKWI